jgi:hypothetical protein
MMYLCPIMLRSFRSAACAVLVLFLGTGIVLAADTAGNFTWTNGAKDYNWSTPGNWSGNVVPDDQSQATISGNSTEVNPIKYSSGKGVRDLSLDAGYLEVTGGSLLASIGASIGNSTGTAELTIDANATVGLPYVALNIGTVDKGTAIVNLHGGTLSGSITVGANPGATAILKGYGTVSSVNQASLFTLKGQVIASGGTLTLTSVSPTFTTAQSSAGNAGWYAVSGGKLVTPDASSFDVPLPTGPTGEGVWVWGDQTTDYGALTMVNSVAIRYKVVDPNLGHGVNVNLLANDNPGAHAAPAGTTFIGYWHIAVPVSVTDMALLGLYFRYDNSLAQGSAPTLYFWNGTAWDKRETKIIKRGFICYYGGSDPLLWGDYALGIGASPSVGQK